RDDVQRAAKLAYLAGDHVHAVATAGQPVDLGGGGEAGLQDQGVELGIGQYGAGPEQAAGLAAAANRRAVQPAAVVTDLDDHFRTFAAHGDVDRALFRLARGAAGLGRFDPVGDRIAQHVL